MCMEELVIIFKNIDIFDEHFTDKDVQIAFGLS